MSAAKAARLALRQVFALLVADEHDLEVIQAGQSGDDRLVVAQSAIAVELEKLVEDQLDVITRLRALGMARDLDDLPGVEVGIDFPFELGELAAEPANLFGDPGGVDAGTVPGVLNLHLGQACFHLEDRRLEGEPRFARTAASVRDPRP